jgi:hypothetical protein
MDDGAAAAISVMIFILIVFTGLAFVAGQLSGQRIAMAEAFNRGLAVQCPGVTGHHWECEP